MNVLYGSYQLIDLPLAPKHRPGVVENFSTIAAIANQVIAIPLPEVLEAASVFES